LIVLDASAAVELVTDTEMGASVAQRLLGESLQIPTHCDLEVGAALRRAVLRHELSEREARVALDVYQSAASERWDIRLLLGRAWQLLHHIAIADALYVALAERLRAPLLTCDAGLAHSHGHEATIEMV
jgi:predicted nucleic acid-binding protein